MLRSHLRRTLFASLLLLNASAGHATDSVPLLLPHPAQVSWPTQSWPAAPLPENVDKNAVGNVLRTLFEKRSSANVPDNRALLVVQRGKIVLELYAEGFNQNSSFKSWSMAKSITNAFTGILVQQEKMTLQQIVSRPEWQTGNDGRDGLTIEQLLHMNTGLANDDDAGGQPGFVGRMLFTPSGRLDVAHFAADVPLNHKPGVHWAYSTATTNLLAAEVQAIAGRGRATFNSWVQTELTAPLGISSLQLEYDRSGHFIGGAFAWATTRDWARLGYLYLRDGVWDGERILAPGWVAFSRQPAKAANNGNYGAHFWITASPGPSQSPGPNPQLQAFYMSGSGGQVVMMVPERDLVIVRLGAQHNSDWGDLNHLLDQLAFAFPTIEAQ